MVKVKYLGQETWFKTSTNTGIFYEFIDNVCEVENKEDIDFFANHNQYDLEKKGKKGSDE